jgi:hypothetical protein
MFPTICPQSGNSSFYRIQQNRRLPTQLLPEYDGIYLFVAYLTTLFQ